ncbi:MAG TPA: cytochrome c [Bryobacteraceae bacterium]|jgi:ubiquinol-cytochrome c reductase cytochrome c subunit
MRRVFTRLLAWAAVAATVGFMIAQVSGNAENGKKLFSKDGCYQCHGTQGQGTTAGARLAPKPIALAAIIAYVRRPSGQMPPYTAKVISDAELADIRAYLSTIPDPPAAKSVPLLNQ